MMLDIAAGVLLAVAIAGAFSRGAAMWSTASGALSGWGCALMIAAAGAGVMLILARLPS